MTQLAAQPEAAPPSDAEGLARLLRARAPGVVLLEERLIRRLVREDRDLRAGQWVPHTRCYAVPRRLFVRHVRPDEVDVSVAALPETVLVLPPPDPAALAEAPELVLLDYWRRLFHVRIDAALRVRAADQSLARPRVLELIDALGQTPFDEVRAVLEDEGLIAQRGDATSELCEFVALYQELRYFEPAVLDRYFPALADSRPAVETLVDQLVDGAALYAEARPDGAPSPQEATLAADALDAAAPEPEPPRERTARRTVARADGHAAKGNDARAAVLYARAARSDVEALAVSAAERRDACIGSLARRLSALTSEGATAYCRWVEALTPFVLRATGGMRRVEARLLHDLQKACHDEETDAFRVDLPRAIRGLGRTPLRQELPCQRVVNVARHLARAHGRLPAVRVPPDDRAGLARLVAHAQRVAEARAREVLGRRLVDALRAAGLVPESVPEEVAFDRIVAELLDQALQRGFIAFGDLRDALARNELKLGDLASVGEFFRGDPLLRLDRGVDRALDAVYHRGEVYRRALQRLSSLGFAVAVGRLLVRYAIVPFGGAFLIVEGLQHIVGPLWALATDHHPVIFTLPRFLVVGALIFLLLHVPLARKAAKHLVFGLGDALRVVFVTFPGAVLRLPPIRWLRATRFWRAFRRWFVRPLVIAVVVAVVVAVAAQDRWLLLHVGLPLFGLLAAFLASRVGRRVEESVEHGVVMTVYRLRYDVVPNVIAAVMAFFKRVVELVEIVLYKVDQLLRFRRGQGAMSLAARTVFGTIWAFFAYLVRLYVNLLVEPQVNPIKHFPVVTVSHKIILPLTPLLVEIVATPLSFLGPVVATTFASVTVVLLPGVFGFLVWEFKENWRLYAANRRRDLAPVIVGSHGERLSQLLRPGFHSGTVPKIFARLRRTERRRQSDTTGRRDVDVRRQMEALHHVEEAIARFIERGLLAILARSGRFARGLEVADVHLTPHRVRVALACPDLAGAPLVLAFDEQSGFLVACVERRGWVDALEATDGGALETALIGLYKEAGVDLVREQILSILPGEPAYDVDPRGLIVWPTRDFGTEVVYRLRSRHDVLLPRVTGPQPTPPLPRIPVGDIFFRRRPVPWPRWVAAWAPEETSAAPLADILGPLSLLDDGLRNAAPTKPATAARTPTA